MGSPSSPTSAVSSSISGSSGSSVGTVTVAMIVSSGSSRKVTPSGGVISERCSVAAASRCETSTVIDLGDVGRQRLDVQLVGLLADDAALGDAGRVLGAVQVDAHRRLDLLAQVDLEQVEVHDLAADRVVLLVLDDHRADRRAADLEVDDGAAGDERGAQFAAADLECDGSRPRRRRRCRARSRRGAGGARGASPCSGRSSTSSVGGRSPLRRVRIAMESSPEHRPRGYCAGWDGAPGRPAGGRRGHPHRQGAAHRQGRARCSARLARSTRARGRATSCGRRRRPREALDKSHLEAAERMVDALGTMKGAAMKIGQLASFIDTEFLPPEYRELYQDKLADAALRGAADVVEHRQVGARGGVGGPGRGAVRGLLRTTRPRPRRSARSTARCCPTGAWSRSRCSTPASPRRCAPTCRTPG